MKQGIKEAKATVADFLAACEAPPMLFTVSAVADRAAIGSGRRKTELFRHLDDYEAVLPASHCARWEGDGSGGGTLRVFLRGSTPPAFRPHPGVFDAGVDMGPQAMRMAAGGLPA